MGIHDIIFLTANSGAESVLSNSGLPVIITGAAIIILAMIISRLRSNRKSGQEETSDEDGSGTVVALETCSQEGEEEDLSDDSELAAVIAAAIYAYEEGSGTPVPADGLIVRSMRRVNKSRWRNA